ncbi:glutathione S-transferase family protein [Shewanella vesiculosa]|jgi:glutathione S-transferase|uniref:glutathione S-transferase family protein n=1 Tax=Shewanella vesiculosa TaxID=518738 RepID=UPI003CFFC332|tara:strand:+ start:3257 stop:3889 length:633 start_codon:yes stop_codon:yes gene_type:complete
MITLYGTQKSRALRVSWLLEELGVEWQFHAIDFAKGENKAEAFLALNPSGKMPVITEGEFVLSESAAIMRYLAEKYGQGNWLPKPGTQASGIHERWVSFVISELEQPLWSMGKHRFALPQPLRLEAMFAVAKWEFDQAAAIAEAWVPDTGFVCGDSPTIADILLAQTLGWAMGFEQTLPPKLMAFRDRLKQRPALANALAKTEALADVTQ